MRSDKPILVTRIAIMATAAALAVASAAAAQPTANVAISFDIPAQDLGRALTALARQSNREIYFPADLTRGRRAPQLKGTLSIDEALKRLLMGTGLTYRLGASGAIAIEGSAGMVPAALEAGPGQTLTASTDGDAEAIVVTGTNIRGLRNRTAPVQILDREAIEATGHATTAGLIESLPQNFALASQSAPAGFPGVTGDRTQGAAINLRGIGEGTTLVLLNGRRLPLAFDGSAADVSMLPLSIMERVEILTDGASALYGADAVGGVVNFVTLRSFEGVEVRGRAGIAPGGIEEYRAGLTAGTEWGTGSVLVSGEYFHRDLLPASKRDFVPATSLVQSLLPRDDNASVLVSARQELAALTLTGDLLYTHRKTFNRGGRFNSIFNEDSKAKIDQTSGNLGVAWAVGAGWQVVLSGSYGRFDRHSIRGTTVGGPRGISDGVFKSLAADLKADGPIAQLSGGTARAAIGASWRREDFHLKNSVSGFVTNRISEEQKVASAYGELHLPIFGPPNARPGINRLELSLAGRYDHYSNFGSSFDPRVGIAWEPASGLAFRGAWGTSYVAPRLSDYDTSNTAAASFFDLDPGSPFGFSYQLQVAGGADAASLRPQTSRNWTFGADFAPPGLKGLKLGLGYYDIKYRNQIAAPPQSASILLANPGIYGSLFIRNPTLTQVEQYVAIGEAGLGFFPFDEFFQPDPDFDPASVQVILDFRRRNLAVVRARGVDFSGSYSFEAGPSTIRFGVEGVYILERKQKVTEASPGFETVDTVYNPPEFRLRGSAGWRMGRWSANAFVNHVGPMKDNRTVPAVNVDSFTTFDANIAYRIEAGDSPLDGLSVTLSAINLFNENPPDVRALNPFDIGFDPANASPFGRLLSIEVVKRW